MRTSLLYGSTHPEVSIRDEISTIFHGSAKEPPRARWGLFRKVEVDKNNQLVLCPQCRKVGNQTHALSHICDRCLGVGYIWKENWVRFYQWPGASAGSRGGMKKYIELGALETNIHVVYLEIDQMPKPVDKIVEIQLDNEGNPVNPVVRQHMYDIRAVDDYRLDHGRLEYYRLTCYKQTIGYIGQPINHWEPGPGRTP